MKTIGIVLILTSPGPDFNAKDPAYQSLHEFIPTHVLIDGKLLLYIRAL